jgi:hypothetical protein
MPTTTLMQQALTSKQTIASVALMLLPLSVELTAVFLILPSKSSVEV